MAWKRKPGPVTTGGYAQQAETIKAGKLVLKISRYHVADLAERIPHLILREIDLLAQHAGGNLIR
jgi:hypothetical protein